MGLNGGHIEWGVIVLVAVTIGQIVLAIDNWVHRQERKHAALEYQTSGKASLQAQIVKLEQDLRDYQRFAAQAFSTYQEQQERLRLERASTLASDMAGVHATLEKLHETVGDTDQAQQTTLNKLQADVVRLEAQVQELFRVDGDRRRHQRNT